MVRNTLLDSLLWLPRRPELLLKLFLKVGQLLE